MELKPEPFQPDKLNPEGPDSDALGPEARPARRRGKETEHFLREQLLLPVAHLPWGVLLIATGIGLYFSLPIEPNPAMVAMLLSATALLWALFPRHLSATGTISAHLPLTIILLVLIGFSAAIYRANGTATPLLNDQWKSHKLHLIVEEVHPLTRNRIRYIGRVENLSYLPQSAWPKRVRLSAPDQGPRFTYGDKICARVMLKRPDGPLYPKGYDFARALWFQSIGGSGYSLSPLKQCTGDSQVAAGGTQDLGTSQVKSLIAALRNAISARLQNGLTETQQAFAQALIIGERGGIPKAQLEAVRKAGLGHLLAISGLHMAVFAGTVFFLLRALMALSPNLTQTVAIKKWAAIGALFSGGIYFLISGQSIPTQRAFLMITIMFVAIMIERPALTLRNVTLAALVILLFRPESLLTPGFQMSFAAVTALVAIYQLYMNQPKPEDEDRAKLTSPLARPFIYLGGILLTSFIATIATAPYAIYHFHQLSYMGPVGNLLAIPVFTVLIMPAAVATLALMPFGLEGVVLPLFGVSIDILLAIAQWTASFDPALLYTGSITVHALIFATLAGLVFLFAKKHRARWAALPLALAALYTAKPISLPDVYINKEGTVITIRGADGKLHAPDSRKGNFEISKWLRAEGDSRSPGEIRQSQYLSCDDAACSAVVKGRSLTLIKSIAALEEACQTSDIVIYHRTIRRHCSLPELTFSTPELKRGGAIALYIENTQQVSELPKSQKKSLAHNRKKSGQIIVKTANSQRRHRLWGGGGQ